jgi:hypothetical protein
LNRLWKKLSVSVGLGRDDVPRFISLSPLKNQQLSSTRHSVLADASTRSSTAS